jgi:hypothetical protein
VAIALCAVVYFAVDQADLDAKALNAVPALGVVLAFALALGVGVPSVPRLVRGDKLRIAVAALFVFFCAPLIAAELASSSTASRSSAGSSRREGWRAARRARASSRRPPRPAPPAGRGP